MLAILLEMALTCFTLVIKAVHALIYPKDAKPVPQVLKCSSSTQSLSLSSPQSDPWYAAQVHLSEFRISSSTPPSPWYAVWPCPGSINWVLIFSNTHCSPCSRSYSLISYGISYSHHSTESTPQPTSQGILTSVPRLPSPFPRLGCSAWVLTPGQGWPVSVGYSHAKVPYMKKDSCVNGEVHGIDGDVQVEVDHPRALHPSPHSLPHQ